MRANWRNGCAVSIRRLFPFAVRANQPDWLAERFSTQFAEAEALALVQALNQPATPDLRVNTFKAERAEVQARLAKEGVAVEPTRTRPSASARAECAALFRTQCFADGLIEVQDEGSQLLSYLLEPKRNEMIVDFCAEGAGGKTLHLGGLMANTPARSMLSTSPRNDWRSSRRVCAAPDWATCAPSPSATNATTACGCIVKINRVLVDAPCSGVGTCDAIRHQVAHAEPAGLVDTQKRYSRRGGATGEAGRPVGICDVQPCCARENEDRRGVSRRARRLPHRARGRNSRRAGIFRWKCRGAGVAAADAPASYRQFLCRGAGAVLIPNQPCSSPGKSRGMNT